MDIPIRALTGFIVPGIPKLIVKEEIHFVTRHLQQYIKPTPHYDRAEIIKEMMSHKYVKECECYRKDNLVHVEPRLTNGDLYRLTVEWVDPIS